MAAIQFFRETALPGTLQPSSIYFIANPATPAYFELYVTDAAGTATKRTPTQADIQSLINSSIAASNNLTIVNTIAARDALLPLTTTKWVYVIDATGDATVTSGGATYLYDPSGAGTWIKAAEAESLDLTLNWSSIVGKPTSTPAQIDAAVTAAHTHANMTQLNKIGEDSGGNLLYNGSLPATGWTSANW